MIKGVMFFNHDLFFYSIDETNNFREIKTEHIETDSAGIDIPEYLFLKFNSSQNSTLREIKISDNTQLKELNILVYCKLDVKRDLNFQYLFFTATQ